MWDPRGRRLRDTVSQLGAWDQTGRARGYDVYDVEQSAEAFARFEELIGTTTRERVAEFVQDHPVVEAMQRWVTVLGLALTASGWATYNDWGGEWLEDLHEGAANALLALVGLHVFAVIASSWLHRENLVAAMIGGHKPGRPEDGVARAWRGVATLMVAAVIGFWAWQWQAAPAPAVGRPFVADKHRHGERDHHD